MCVYVIAKEKGRSQTKDANKIQISERSGF